jgi:hypothetical protein
MKSFPIALFLHFNALSSLRAYAIEGEDGYKN